MPEKLMSSVPGSGRWRGNAKAFESPSRASASSAGPPGNGSRSSRAVLSNASPAASSRVFPMTRSEVGDATSTSCECPPETSSARNGYSGGCARSRNTAKRCPCKWLTAYSGRSVANASALAAATPTTRLPISPGPAVTAIPSSRSSVTSARVSASSTAAESSAAWRREAISGTIPPYFAWNSSWFVDTFESTRTPSSTTAVAVSSHDVSIPSSSIVASRLGLRLRLRRAQRSDARRSALRAVEAERARIAELIAHVRFRASDRVAQPRVRVDGRVPRDRFGGDVVLPQTDEPAAVDDRVALQVTGIAPQREEGVERADQRVVRIARRLERCPCIALLRKQQQIIARCNGHQIQRRERVLRCVDAEPGEGAEFGKRRRSDPGEETARERFERCGSRRCVRKRVGPPWRVAIALLIEPAVRRDAPNLAGRLQHPEGDRQRRRHPPLAAFE